MNRFSNERTMSSGHRVNNQIRVPQLFVIGADGIKVGVITNSEARRLAAEADLDLVEINPRAMPPVAKIMDYGKFKYDEKKKQAEARRRRTVVEVKEIKFRPKTDDHDINTKLRQIHRFLSEGNKVKVTCRFRGREITRPEIAHAQLNAIAAASTEIGHVEVHPQMEARTMTMTLAPGKARQERKTG